MTPTGYTPGPSCSGESDPPYILLEPTDPHLSIWFTKQLAQHLPPLASSSPILAIAVHPGAVATEQQKGATEAYGLLGKALEVAAAVGFMSPEQGSESALWAGTAPAVAQRREEAQGAYFTEADGKVSYMSTFRLLSRS